MKCPVCDDGLAQRFVRRHGDFDLVDCGACGVGWSRPMRAADAAWYESSPLYLNAKALHLQLDWHQRRFLALAGDGGGRRLLDVGCGTGAFLERAQARGFVPSGIDFDRDNVALARSRHRLEDVQVLSLADYAARFPGRRFDVVTLFEVIEHVEDPPAFLRTVRALLRPGGVLGLSTPNRARRLDTLRDGDLPPNHLTRWSECALRRLVQGGGFEVEVLEIKPVAVEDLVGFLRARLRLGVARRMLARSVAARDTARAARARVLMRCKDVALTAVAIPALPMARLGRWRGVGQLCIARSPA